MKKINFKSDLPTILTFLGGVLSLVGGIWMTMLEDPKNGYLLPMILIIIGGLLTLSSAYWASIQGNKDKNVIIELQQKNIELNNQALNQINGGDTWCYLHGGARNPNGGFWNMPISYSIFMMGNYPLYDVNIEMSEYSPDLRRSRQLFKFEIGTLKNSMRPTYLPEIILPDVEKVDYLARINNRNGDIIQHLAFVRLSKDAWLTGTKVFRQILVNDRAIKTIELFEEIDDDFPKEGYKWMNY